MKQNPIAARRHRMKLMLLAFINNQPKESKMLLLTDDLAKALGYHPTQYQRIKKCLKNQGIKFYEGGDGRPFTTTELISDFINRKEAANDTIYFDEKQHGSET